MKKKTLLLVCLYGFFTFGSKAQTEVPDSVLNLQYFIQAALDHNKQLKNQRLNVEKSDIIRKQIRHTYIPTIEASGTYAYSSGEVNLDTDPIPFSIPSMTIPLSLPSPIGTMPVTTPDINSAIPGINESLDYNGSLWMGGLTAKWTLFTGLKVPYLSKAMKHKIAAEEAMLAQSEAEIIAEVSSYYDKIALLTQANTILSESEKRLVREEEVAKRALQEGLITQHDFQKIAIAKLELASKQIEYAGSKSLLHLKLQQLTGLSLSIVEALDVNLDPFNPKVGNGSYLNRAELIALDEAIIASEYKLKSETSGYLPKVQAFATHSYAGVKNGALGPLGFNEISAYPINAVGVGFKWELFDGLHTHEQRQKAKIELLQTQNKKEEAAELLMLNYNNSLNQLQVNNAKLNLQKLQQESAKKSLEISYKEYQNGLIKISEFLEAQADYEKMVLNYYQTIYDQRQSTIQLLNATGELNSTSLQN